MNHKYDVPRDRVASWIALQWTDPADAATNAEWADDAGLAMVAPTGCPVLVRPHQYGHTSQRLHTRTGRPSAFQLLSRAVLL